MKTRLLSLWEMLATNYWFIPTLMAGGAIGLAFLTGHWDSVFTAEQARNWGWIWVGSAAGAREMLSVIAGSMITVAGVTFSITIVALAQASSQYGPLLLRNFMEDKSNQVVLGTFIATFIYCLLILRTVHDDQVLDSFVPHISVTCGIVFAVASLAVLIYFIHHVCDALQAENLVARIGCELEETIRREFPESSAEAGVDAPAQGAWNGDSENACLRVRSTGSGYIQAVDTHTLLQIAAAHDTQFFLERHAGDFVAEGNFLLCSTDDVSLTEKTIQKIRRAFILGRHRTPTQDTDHAVHQLVQVAVRALSAGINDSFTAITCVDWLGSALTTMAARKPPPGGVRDEQGKLRLLLKAPSFPRMLEAAFNQVRQNAKHNVAVSIRLMETLERIALQIQRKEDLQAISQQASMIIFDCEEGLENPWDLAMIQALGKKVFTLTEEGRQGPIPDRLFTESRND